MELHRANPACAKCHHKMDAIGLTLENFDAHGAWRETYYATPIHATGVMPDRETLKGPAGLKAYLMKHRDPFVEALGAKLLRFALGRNLDARDRAALAQMPENVAKQQYRFSQVILEVVRSDSFQQGFGVPLPQAK